MDNSFGYIVLQADEKGRFRVPSKYRANLGESRIFGFHNNRAPYLSIMSSEKANELIDKLMPLIRIVDDEVSRQARVMLSNIVEIKEDTQKRFSLSPELRGALKLGKEAVFVGVGSKIELWDKSEFDKMRDEESEKAASDTGILSEMSF